MKPHAVEAAHIRVTGRVQGVGYRFFVEAAAIRKGISGYVRNMPDQSVEVLAEGPREVLASFIDMLKVGPPAARVEDVSVEMTVPGGASGFSIRY